jgi:SPOR domain
LQRARYTVTSRTIDEAHRPRIVRPAARARALRPPPAPIVSRRRHRRPKLGLVLGAALAGWAIILPVSTPQWPSLIASASAPASAPLFSGGTPLADARSVVVPVPATTSAAAPDQTPTPVATADGAAPSHALGAPVAMTAAAEMAATGTFLPSAAGLLVREHPRAEPRPARSQPAPSSAVAHTTRHVSERPHQIVVQLSSYADQARARQAAERLHRSFEKILNGAPMRTEEAEVHGKPVWRVVAGPVRNREHGRKLCDALRHAGQSCVIMAL